MESNDPEVNHMDVTDSEIAYRQTDRQTDSQTENKDRMTNR